MKNRNYFERPIQGNGRDFHGYGNTGPFERERDPWAKPAIIATVVIVAYFVWQYLGR